MKEAVVTQNVTVQISDVAIPKPQAGQLLIRTIVSGTNPKDWKYPKIWGRTEAPRNQGDDIAGVVEAIGEGVTGFVAGDRVAAFHELGTPNGSFAEYSIAWARSAFHIPENISFEGKLKHRHPFECRNGLIKMQFKRLQQFPWLV